MPVFKGENGSDSRENAGNVILMRPDDYQILEKENFGTNSVDTKTIAHGRPKLVTIRLVMQIPRKGIL